MRRASALRSRILDPLEDRQAGLHRTRLQDPATRVKVRQERSAATRWGANVLREAVEKITYPGLDLSRVEPPVKPARALRRQSVGP